MSGPKIKSAFDQIKAKRLDRDHWQPGDDVFPEEIEVEYWTDRRDETYDGHMFVDKRRYRRVDDA